MRTVFDRSCTQINKNDVIWAHVKTDVNRSSATMVYHSGYHGKCWVCKTDEPKHWFCCDLCGTWMGMLCNPRQVPLAGSTEIKGDFDERFEPHGVSLHCYIWTSMIKKRHERSDLCKDCCENVILTAKSFGVKEITDRVMPAEVKRKILQYVEWGSWW